MINKILLALSLLWLPLHAQTFTIEHASTSEETAWGLMGRHTLSPNHGMAFTYPKTQYTGVWMFNCYIDLSVAFLNADHVILQIEDLKAYPEKMDPKRPVYSLNDFYLYPLNDPIRTFFEQHTIYSKYPIKYMLEMPKGWFQENEVEIGDKIVWDDYDTVATIEKK